MLKPFESFSGVAAPLPQSNVNTDAIIAAPYLRSPSADLAEGLFGRWRRDENGASIPSFVLNREPYRQASILLAGVNFGCGSSREVAVWALLRFGIRCVIAPSFADIFYENAFRNGLLPAIVPQEALDGLMALALGASGAAGATFSVDLAASSLTGPDGVITPIGVPAFRRDAMLRGDDDIAMTLRFDADISAFVNQDRKARPWIHAIENPR